MAPLGDTHPPKRKHRIARTPAFLAVALGLWSALVLLFAAAHALTGPASWQQAIQFGASFWALWLVLLPAVAWFALRVPIGRRTLLRDATVHGLACLLVVLANHGVIRAVPRIFPDPLRSDAARRPMGLPQRPLGPPGAFAAMLGLRAALDVLVYGCVVGGCAAFATFQSSQERERRAAELEASLTRATLQALRMQINPHFLFNTLNSISALIYVSPRAADEMLGDLSGLFRRSLDSMQTQEVSLDQELEFIGGYLRIEQRRLGDRLRVEQAVPDGLKQAVVPALILQPLVENAIRHGIEARRGPGLISIEAIQEDAHLHLIVRDDGRGLPDSGPSPSTRPGIGLANTRARLECLYGPKQTFSLRNTAPRGCRVDIHLPLHWGPQPVPAVPNPAA